MTILSIIMIIFGEMRIINPLDLALYDLFKENQQTILYNFFQDLITMIFIWMILTFFKNQVILILYQQTVILDETNSIL
jgi:hypothetical protein